ATLDAYFKFAFTRNTWDRLVSAYCYSKPIYEAKHGSFESWIGDVCERVRTSRYKPGEHFAPQSDYLEHEGREALDFVGSFENLQQDWRHVCDRLELPPCPLPRLNRTRSKQGHYSACYTDRTRDLVAEAYAREISRMDYRFERR
ncbi:MAG TPA: sulfotransferase family 2 domain-containing protein, partial [Prosthecobacter sp.]|nr:sulfotransferase family 2 domain-containing protein [Prosthecobacter sp.]